MNKELAGVHGTAMIPVGRRREPTSCSAWSVRSTYKTSDPEDSLGFLYRPEVDHPKRAFTSSRSFGGWQYNGKSF